MENFNVIQIITGLGAAFFILLTAFSGIKTACENLGWVTKKRKEKLEQKQKEEDQRFQKIIDDSISKAIEDQVMPKLEETQQANADQQEILKQLTESSNDLMRHEMTKIYYKYLPYRRILQYDKESFVKLYKDYHTQHGNTIIDDIHEIMADWIVVTEEKDLVGQININKINRSEKV